MVKYQDDDGNWFSYVLWTEHLYVMNADGSGIRQLTTQPGARFSSGAWFPDGRIVFLQGGETYSMNVDGSSVAPFSVGGHNIVGWSPDGSKLAFTDSGNYSVMNADGTNVTQLTNARGGAGFSPDGTKLVFVTTASSIVDGEPMVWPSNWAIFVLNADDSGLKLMASHSAGYGVVAAGPGVGALLGGPVWSPDGTAIAINVDADNFSFTSRGIELISVDGSNSFWIDNTAGASGAPAWRPRHR